MEKSKLQNIIERIEQQEQQIAAYGKLDKELLNRINYKIRLDWNYYSNRMEGGTLTQEETRSVMVGNIDVQGKPIKDVIEMSGHDTVVRELLKVGSAEHRLSEARIKDIHRAIMHEENAEEKKKIGQWKTEANMLYSYKGEKIEFAPPDEVPSAMHELLGNINAYLDRYFKGKHKEHPIIAISQFHAFYLSIHPFYDGNGRTARILTNLLLIACGLPPIIIKEALKDQYYQLLGDIQAYGGNPDLLCQFMAERVADTQSLILKALQGGDIEEPDDLDKKIAVLERQLQAVDPDDEIKEQLGETYFKNIFKNWLDDLIRKTLPKIQKFNRLFTGTEHSIRLLNGNIHVNFKDEGLETILSELSKQAEKIPERRFRNSGHDIAIRSNFENLVKGGLNTFNCNYGLEIQFDPIKYRVWVDVFNDGSRDTKQIIEDRLLHKPLNTNDIQKITSTLANSILEHIDYHTQQAGLRPGKKKRD